MRRADEMARGRADGGYDSAGIGASGAIGARAAESQESAARAALVAVSEDASSLTEVRIGRDVALVFAGANAHVCPPVIENRTQETSTTIQRRRSCSGCAREHKLAWVTRSVVDASSAKLWLCLP